MTRTKVFVSYGRDDHAWLERFSQHIAVLQRAGLVDLWADSRIGVGADWGNEIERALTAAKVAVLLVSPDFLASDYIWEYEMPRIIEHAKAGMEILPLIVRPCAWRLEKPLSKLQARPADGRALSQGSDSQIDSDLSAFVYELAARIGRSPVASDVSDVGAASSEATGAADEVVGEWAGYYNLTLPVRLLIRGSRGNEFRGIMEYPEGGAITIVGGIVDKRWPPDDPIWAQVGGAVYDGRWCAVSFRETGYEKQGTSPFGFGGEYRLFMRGDEMTGGWFFRTHLISPVTLRRA